MPLSKETHVAVGVVRRPDGRILITQRAADAHQGGLWEFPGGKVETGERVLEALCRELEEEVGISVTAARPLIRVDHCYPDKRVLLDVWQVDAFDGDAQPCEGQPLQWVIPERLRDYTFPAANQPIIAAALLPAHYAILEGRNLAEVWQRFNGILANGIRLLQLRLKDLPHDDLVAVVPDIVEQCRLHHIQLLVNSDLPLRIAGDGVHLSSRSLLACAARPTGHRWVGASCHDLTELRHAESIGVDFVVLAPVMTTTTHPDAKPLGWQGFAELVAQVNLPVFALGGLTTSDGEQAMAAGAQGIAGISAFFGASKSAT